MDPLTAISIGSSLLGGLGGGGGGQRISQDALNRASQLGPLASFNAVTLRSSLGGMYGYGPATGYKPGVTPGMIDPNIDQGYNLPEGAFGLTSPGVAQPAVPAYTAPRDVTQLLRTTFTGPSGQTIRGQDALRDIGINLDAVSNTQAANMIDRAIASGVLTAPAGSAQTMPQTGMMTQQPTSNLGFNLGGQYSDIVNKALAGAGGLFGQLADYVPGERAAEIYKEQLSLLEPTFQEQENRLQANLFKFGRGGLQVGGVNPDVYGFQKARGETLANIAAGSRAQALDEGQQMLKLASGLLTQGLGINEAERQMIALGIDAETARAAAQYAAGSLELSPYTGAIEAANTASTNRMGLFSGIASGLTSNEAFMNKLMGG